MLLWGSQTSPFARKVRVVVRELDLTGQVEERLVDAASLESLVSGDNPLGKIPCLVADDGRRIHDSPVICDYLDVSFGGSRLHPSTGPERWTVMTLQALADGIMDAAVLCRYESLRPEPERSADWVAKQQRKILRSLDTLAAAPPAAAMTIGGIALACALGYLDFRQAVGDWRPGRPALAAWFAAMAERPSLLVTRHG